MKTKQIYLSAILFTLTLIFSAISLNDCPTLTIKTGDKVLESYENTISPNEILSISITGAQNRFKLSKVKVKLIPAGDSDEIQVKGYSSKFSNNPVIEIPVKKLIQGDVRIEKIVLSVLEIIDESTGRVSDCFYYGQEWEFWVK